jgi:hypothetical protein
MPDHPRVGRSARTADGRAGAGAELHPVSDRATTAGPHLAKQADSSVRTGPGPFFKNVSTDEAGSVELQGLLDRGRGGLVPE